MQVQVDEIIARREVLVIDGAMGQVGGQAASRLMQIILHMLFTALQRQQGRPEEERVRVCADAWLGAYRNLPQPSVG